MAGFQVDMSPLVNSSMTQARASQGIGQALGGAIGQIGQAVQRNNQQEEVALLIEGAMNGRPESFQELMAKYPDQAQVVAQKIDDPRYDIDEDDRASFMDTNARKAIISQVKGEDYATNFFGGGNTIKQQELNIKQEANDIRRLENQERALDRQLARETNELKKQQLESKLVDTKTQKENKINDVKIEGERAIVEIDDATSVAGSILAHPGLDAAVGGTSLFPTIPGSEAANFESKLEQFKSKQFLTNIQKMKGMGSLSESEGKKIAAAAGALDLSMSESAFRQEMDVIIKGLEKAKTFINKKYGKTESNGRSDMDNQALAWAKSNPNDPRAASIMTKLGVTK